MAGSVEISKTTVPVVTGQMGTATVRIRNSGVVVDQFSVTVLGEAGAWTTAVPAVLSLFPGAEGTIELHFAPPRTPGVGFGATPFGVRVDASQDPDGSVVEEGEVDLQAFTEVQAKLTPRTSETKRKARHEVLVDNRGNSEITADIDASDPDDLLAFDIHPRTITVPAGGSVPVPVRVAAKSGFLRGTDKHRPFQVKVNVPGNPMGPIALDGTLMQKAGLPKFLVPLVAGAVAIALIALVAPALKKDGGSGKLSLTSDDAATTTTAAAPGEQPVEAPPDPNAPATPEEAAAAAAAEAQANGSDTKGGTGTSGSGGGGTDPAAASSGPSTTAAPAAGGAAGDEGSSDVTSPPATTAPPPTSARSFVGRWAQQNGTDVVDLSQPDTSSLLVVWTSVRFSGSNKGSAAAADANDGSFAASLVNSATSSTFCTCTFTLTQNNQVLELVEPATGKSTLFKRG
jgi:hypothetical protein